MTIMEGEVFDPTEILPMISIMIGVVGVFPFAGTGFLESKDQLWIIRSAPKGASRFMRARIATGFMMAIPLSLTPSILMAILFNMTPLLTLQIFVTSFIVVCGSVMVAMGITAQNPNYEDTKSAAHQTVLVSSMMLTQFTLIGPLFAAIFLDIGLGFNLFHFMESVFGIDGFMAVEMMLGPAALLLLGGLMLYLGVRSLGKVEV